MTKRIPLSQLTKAHTVAGNGTETILGWVIEDLRTGQREWLQGASRETAFAIARKRAGTFSVRGFGKVGRMVCIFA